MKVLVTGSEGYIGKHLCKMIKETRSDIELYRLDKIEIEEDNYFCVDIRYPHYYSRVEKIHYDTIIHLAALVRVGESVKHPTLYYNNNMQGTVTLLSTLNCNNFIFASTGQAEQPNSPYSYSKKICEDIIEDFKYKGWLKNYTIFRFYNVIGTDGFPPTNPEGLMLNLFKIPETKEFKIYGTDYDTKDGTCVREYVHVNDICAGLIRAIDNPANAIENLAYGDTRTTTEIVEMFVKVNNLECTIKSAPRRKGDLVSCYLRNPSSYMVRNYTYEDMLRL